MPSDTHAVEGGKATSGMARKGSQKESSAIRLSEFLKKPPTEPKPVYILRGTDPYLLSQARQAIRAQVLGPGDPGMALMEVDGPDAVLADVLDALRTPPFLAPRRLVGVREADPFITQHRAVLERYLTEPSPCGSLCLEVESWNESTNLAKQVTKVGLLIQCEAADPAAIPGWLRHEAQTRYQKTLTPAAAQMLTEYLGPDFAALTSAVDMLALYAGASPTIDAPDVDALVARGHHERIWALCDATAERNLPRALELLDAFWTEGMAAPQIVGAMRPTFRQLVRARALSRRMSLDDAMARAGVPYFARNRVRGMVRALSDAHLAAAYQTLVDADLQSKTMPDDRLAMETMIHRLCNPEAARFSGSPGSGPAD